jgi:hypothetical protein
MTGNPLAVFTDVRGLTDKKMQALAREMNRLCPTGRAGGSRRSVLARFCRRYQMRDHNW